MKLWMTIFLSLLLAGCSAESASAASTPKTDVSGPYINISQYEFTTVKGKTIDFSNITGYDDVDGLLKTKVEGFIDYSTPGDYYPSITCTDLSGNKSSVIITVHVLDSVILPSSDPSATVEPTPSPTASTCDSENAEDPNQPCKVVISSDLSDYQTIYEGEEGKKACAASSEDGECEEIHTNDGTLWGYGKR